MFKRQLNSVSSGSDEHRDQIRDLRFKLLVRVNHQIIDGWSEPDHPNYNRFNRLENLLLKCDRALYGQAGSLYRM